MSRESPAIVESIALSLLRDLSGFRGYPKGNEQGERTFARALQESVVSVDHARAVVESFDQEFPTLLRIRQAAADLRSRFEESNRLREWRTTYGPPEPVVPDFTPAKDREIDRLWSDVTAFLRTTQFDGHGDIQRVQIGRCWQIAKHLGYAMDSPQQREIDAYEHAHPQSRERLPVKKTPITQADIDKAKALHDGKALAGNDAPDRWE